MGYCKSGNSAVWKNFTNFNIIYKFADADVKNSQNKTVVNKTWL